MSVSRAGSSMVKRSNPAAALSQCRCCSSRSAAWYRSVSWVNRLSSKSARQAVSTTRIATTVRTMELTGISRMLHRGSAGGSAGSVKGHKRRNLGGTGAVEKRLWGDWRWKSAEGAGVALKTQRVRSALFQRPQRFSSAFSPLKPLDRPLQTLAKGNLGRPAKRLARPRDVGSADPRIVGRERFRDDPGLRSRQLEHDIRQLPNGEFVGVAHVRRVGVPLHEKTINPVDLVRDVAEGA